MDWQDYVKAHRAAKRFVDKYDIQIEASKKLSEHEFLLFHHSVKYVLPKFIHMGSFNRPDDSAWKDRIRKIRNTVETYGIAKASWNCPSRGIHKALASQLREALPEYKFEIDYDLYKCLIRK